MNYDAKIDKSKVANSCKYGKTGLQRPNPAWSVSLFVILVTIGSMD